MVGLTLLHDAAGPAAAPEPGRITAVGTWSGYAIPGIDPDSSRIVTPGRPGRSSLLYRMKSRHAVSQMPPLGTVIPDSAAIRLVESWVAGLKPRT
jgi:hypothetical protein